MTVISDTNRRLYPYSIKHVIINLSTCIELLIKFRLLEEHWAFLFDDIDKANEYNLETGDFVSVTFAQGIERLKNLCGIDKQKYFTASKELQKYRNRIVHFTLSDDWAFILKSIVGAIIDIQNFTHNEIIPYIENNDAVKEIESDLTELSMFQNALQAIVIKNEPNYSE